MAGIKETLISLVGKIISDIRTTAVGIVMGAIISGGGGVLLKLDWPAIAGIVLLAGAPIGILANGLWRIYKSPEPNKLVPAALIILSVAVFAGPTVAVVILRSPTIIPHNEVPPTPPAPIYPARSPTDADKEIRVIDTLLGIIQNDVAGAVQDSSDAVSEWWPAIENKDPSYLDEIEKSRQLILTASNKMRHVLDENKQYCEDDICSIISFTASDLAATSVQDFSRMVSSLMVIVGMDDKVKKFGGFDATEYVLQNYIDHARSAIAEWAQSKDRMAKLLLARRAILSRSASRLGN